MKDNKLEVGDIVFFDSGVSLSMHKVVRTTKMYAFIAVGKSETKVHIGVESNGWVQKTKRERWQTNHFIASNPAIEEKYHRMEVKYKLSAFDINKATMDQVSRIEAIIDECLERVNNVPT